MRIDKIDWVDCLHRWYARDDEDFVTLRRSEVGYLLEQIGVKEK